MKNVLIFILAIPIYLLAQIQKNTTTLKISDIVIIDNKGQQYKGKEANIIVQEGLMSEEIMLMDDNNTQIWVRFKITSYNSARSSVKSGAIKVQAKYTSMQNNKSDNRNSENNFYLDNDRKFFVKEGFVFKDGIKSTGIKLSYTGQLID